MPELDKNLTLLAHRGTNIYLEMTAFTPKYAPPTHNYDKPPNKNRSHLLQLCRTLGLYKVNCSLRGDSYGRYTYNSSLVSSTVDYFITDLNPESLRVFTVSQMKPLSDHSKITVYLKRAILNHEAATPKELHNINKLYR